MIVVNARISIDESELEEQFETASGPGGQHVNKSSTAVRLIFDVAHSPCLPDDVRQRLMQRVSGRLDASGKLTLFSQRHRSQQRNREDVRERLAELIREAAVPPKPRRATKPTKAAKKRRVDKKKKRGLLKATRGKFRSEE